MLKKNGGSYVLLDCGPYQTSRSICYTLDYTPYTPPEICRIIERKGYFAFVKKVFYNGGDGARPTLTDVKIYVCPNGRWTIAKKHSKTESDYDLWCWEVEGKPVFFSLNFDLKRSYSVESSEELTCESQYLLNGWFDGPQEFETLKEAVEGHTGFKFENASGYNALLLAMYRYAFAHP